MQAQSLVCGNIIVETRAHYIAIKFREKMLVWFSIAPLQQEPMPKWRVELFRLKWGSIGRQGGVSVSTWVGLDYRIVYWGSNCTARNNNGAAIARCECELAASD